MIAIVIGATGATGKFLVQELINDSNYHEIVILVRRKTNISHSKVNEIIVDFDQLEKYSEYIIGDVAFSCLGTTLKDAGSKEKQRIIDYDYQLKFAEIASQNQVNSFVLVSSMNADSNSNFFYPKIKGELEVAIKKLNFEQLIIFQPGFLLRPNSDRSGEVLGVKVIGFFNSIGLFKKYKPLKVEDLAKSLIRSVQKYPKTKITINTLKGLPLLLLAFMLSCKSKSGNQDKPENQTTEITEENNATYINTNGNTILERYNTPKGTERENYNESDFGYFLQHLPLKPFGSRVLYHTGKEKINQNVYNAVIDLPIGTKDLHQCADATMRLRADYLYQQKRFNEIAFNFLSDGQPRFYSDYVNGDYSESKYWEYLEHIFNYANTASLKNQLQTISHQNIKIGDILIQKGNPYGHAVMVVDLAKNDSVTYVLIAQSYMPAQELQILNNPNTTDGSPWYKVEERNINTPEWNFTSEDWKTWE